MQHDFTIGFEILTSAEVHAASFGRVQVAMYRPGFDQPQSRSLTDPAIFGPAEDFACACGKYRGRDAAGMICDMCGVRIGRARPMHRRRWGHIDLPLAVAHPLVPGATLNALPVLPRAYRDPTRFGDDLNALYADVLEAALRGEPAAEELTHAVARLMCNERLPTPRAYRGHPLRSLVHYMFDWPEHPIRNGGIYLHAVALRLAPRA